MFHPSCVRRRLHPVPESRRSIERGLAERSTGQLARMRQLQRRILRRIFRPAGWLRRILGRWQRGMFRNSYRICAPADYRCHILNSAYSPNKRLVAQLIEQRLGLFQIGGIEAFGEPVVDRGEHRARFSGTALSREQTAEAGGRAQLQ